MTWPPGNPIANSSSLQFPGEACTQPGFLFKQLNFNYLSKGWIHSLKNLNTAQMKLKFFWTTTPHSDWRSFLEVKSVRCIFPEPLLCTFLWEQSQPWLMGEKVWNPLLLLRFGIWDLLPLAFHFAQTKPTVFPFFLALLSPLLLAPSSVIFSCMWILFARTWNVSHCFPCLLGATCT